MSNSTKPGAHHSAWGDQLGGWLVVTVLVGPTVSAESDDRPLVRLPDEAVLSRDEVATVLAALDVDEGLADRSDEPLVRGAIRLLTAQLRPERHSY